MNSVKAIRAQEGAQRPTTVGTEDSAGHFLVVDILSWTTNHKLNTKLWVPQKRKEGSNKQDILPLEEIPPEEVLR